MLLFGEFWLDVGCVVGCLDLDCCVVVEDGDGGIGGL